MGVLQARVDGGVHHHDQGLALLDGLTASDGLDVSTSHQVVDVLVSVIWAMRPPSPILLADVFEAAVVFLEVFGVDGDRERIGGVEGEGLAVEGPFGSDGD